MLPTQVRMRKAEDFRFAFRSGVSAGGRYVVSHLAIGADEETLIGFVVSKRVGNSVIRHRVKRQCRHIMRERLSTLPKGARLVVRALPGAAGRTFGCLQRDIDGTLERALRKLSQHTESKEEPCKDRG